MERNNGRYIHRRQTNNNQHDNHHHHHSHHSNSNIHSTAALFTTPTNLSQSPMSREPLTQHDELIRYIREAWTNVNEHGTTVVYHNESDPLKNFKPFNLEEYWGQRHVQNLHVSHGHQ